MGRTNIELDDRLVGQGLKTYKCKSKRELVHLALTELLRRAKQRDILALRGRITWEADLAELRSRRT